VRGTIRGKRDVIMDAAVRVNPAVHPANGVSQSLSHTLQRRDSESIASLRARLIDATVEALSEGSAPRLCRTRLCL
jgi:hypothetical protein